MKRHLLCMLPLLVLLFSGLAVPRPAVGQQPVQVAPQELYRFRISDTDLGYSLSALYQESIRDGFKYDGVVGGIYRPPAGYTPDPASGLVPLHRWTVVENGWRVYTHHSIYYTAQPSNYTYNGILGYVLPPSAGSQYGRMTLWYSQSYGVFNGKAQTGYVGELPPHSSFAYQGVIAAMPPGILGTRPDFCSSFPPGPCCSPFTCPTGYNVTFYPPPPPPPPPTCDPNEEQSCYGTGGNWDSSNCTCTPQQQCQGGYWECN